MTNSIGRVMVFGCGFFIVEILTQQQRTADFRFSGGLKNTKVEIIPL